MVLRAASSLFILRAMLLVPPAFSCDTVAADAANIIPFAAYSNTFGSRCESTDRAAAVHAGQRRKRFRAKPESRR